MDREKHQFVVPRIYTFIDWFLYTPWPGLKSATLMCWDHALINWAVWPRQSVLNYFCFKDFIYLFLDRGEGWEKESEKYPCVVASGTPPTGTWPETQICDLTWNGTGDLLVHRPVLNPLSHTNQGSVKLFFNFICIIYMCVCVYIYIYKVNR